MGPPLTGFAALPLSIQYKFHAVFASGDVAEAELPESIYETLREFDESTQAIILDHFSTTRFAKIRSKAGYFISLLKLVFVVVWGAENKHQNNITKCRKILCTYWDEWQKQCKQKCEKQTKT